jgi:hypothetical protein
MAQRELEGGVDHAHAMAVQTASIRPTRSRISCGAGS